MLNLKAAKELAAKELGTTSKSATSSTAGLEKGSSLLTPTGSRRRLVADVQSDAGDYEEVISLAIPRFSVGDRVEYRSDTHRQWLQGVVQKVRDGGLVYDLDVKKGAQVGKLRPYRNLGASGESLERSSELNEDSISRRPVSRSSSQTRVLNGGDSSFTSGPPAIPGTSTGRISTASRSSSQRGVGSGTLNMTPRKAAGLALEAEVSLQTRPIRSEASQVSRNLQREQLEWAQEAGRDMVSRAGAVTVRKMVETTKSLLEGLEGALILRAGFMASCFHTWRLEVELSRADVLHREELQKHHDAWAAHFKQSQFSFEEQLKASAEHQLTRREKVRQQADLLLDTWAEGERLGLLRQTFRNWSLYAFKEKSLKRAAAQIHTVVYGWAEGKVKGTVHAALLSWRHLTMSEKEVQQKELEFQKLHGTYEQKLLEEQRRRDQEMARKLADIESRRKDRSKNVESILLQWEAGKGKGTLMMSWKSWLQLVKVKKARARRHQSIQMQMDKWLEGEKRGSLHTCFVQWRTASVLHGSVRRAEEARQKEMQSLQRLLTDERKMHEDTLLSHMSEAERRKLAAKAQVQYVVLRWELGDRKGALTATLRSWQKLVQEVKALARKRQAVHTALMKAIAGELRGCAHIILLNWKALAASERMAREFQAKQAKDQEAQHKHWNAFLQETQAEHDALIQKVYDEAAQAKMKAHQVTTLVLKKFLGGDKVGLLSTTFCDWKQLIQEQRAAELQRASVKDSVLRFIEGDQRAAMHTCFIGWNNYVRLEAVHLRVTAGQKARIDELESKVSKLLNHREAHLIKYAEMLGSQRAGVLLGLAFSAWKDESKGAAFELEAQREREIHMQELQRQHHLAAERRKENQARVLDAMGCRRACVILTEFFCAWAYLWEKARDEWINKLNHNESMHKYSLFIIEKKLKQDNASLLTSTFVEWERITKILGHEARHDINYRTIDEANEMIDMLERQKAELQEQLSLYYQQIDSITSTLQKELKTKEELASELRTAYDKMRKGTVALTTASTMASSAEGGLWSRASSTEGSRRFQKDDAESTPRTRCRTPRDSEVNQRGPVLEPKTKITSSTSNVAISSTSPWRSTTVPAPELPPSLPRNGRQSRGYGDSANSEASSVHCDWLGVVQRMGDEGLINLDGYEPAAADPTVHTGRCRDVSTKNSFQR